MVDNIKNLYYKHWREMHPGYNNMKCKEWRSNNKERKKELDQTHRKNNPEAYKQINKRAKQKYLASEKGIKTSRAYWRWRFANPIYKLSNNLSRGIRKAIQTNKAGRHWETLVSFTLDDLKQHLESKFLPGMLWSNYGKWHIDHVVPQSFFKFKDEKDQEFQYCWSLDNLQPLWAKDNLVKNNKLIGIIV